MKKSVVDDVFSDIFGGGGGSIFDMFFGGRRQRRGSDLRYDLDINFKDAVFGITKTLKIPKMSKCKDCEGSGAENNELETCKTCEGAGKLRSKLVLNFPDLTLLYFNNLN